MNQAFAHDLVERVIRTFLATCLATAAAGVAGVVDLGTAKALGLASLTAAVTAAFGAAAQYVGDPNSASFFDRPQS